MKPTEELMKEHAAITRMLDILEGGCRRLDAGIPVPRADLEQMVEFFVVFADTCHHAKEEKHLFPALEGAGVPRERGPIGVMLNEHELGRKYIGEMKDALARWEDEGAHSGFVSAARGYRNLLLLHIQKENNVLFPLADMRLSAPEQERILQAFDALEREELGPGTHERFHGLLASLAASYLPDAVHA
jgi:hemerythrin-like domain-containing protein